jgi:hypothetical protein
MIEANVECLLMPTYERGDYVKVEFPDGTTGVGEWMWVRVHYCDDEKKLGLRHSRQRASQRLRRQC